MKRENKGFTIAELLIVVAIIAVLVAVAIPTFSNSLESSRQGVDVANLRNAYAQLRLALIQGRLGGQPLDGSFMVYDLESGEFITGAAFREKYPEYDGDTTGIGYGKARGDKLLVNLDGLDPEIGQWYKNSVESGGVQDGVIEACYNDNMDCLFEVYFTNSPDF